MVKWSSKLIVQFFKTLNISKSNMRRNIITLYSSNKEITYVRQILFEFKVFNFRTY